MVLEAIAYGTDTRISPTDRLKALSELSQMATTDDATIRIAATVEAMTTEELETDLAGMLGGVSRPSADQMDDYGDLILGVAITFAPPPARERPKRDSAAFDAEVERRVSQRLRDHANANRDDDVIEGTAEEEDAAPVPVGLLAPPGIDPDDPSLDNRRHAMVDPNGRRLTARGRGARL